MNELLTRAATFAPNSFNPATNALEAIVSTGADVVRRDYQGEYLERLPVRLGAWTMARNPVSVLKDHVRTTDNLVGVASNLRMDGVNVLASIVLSGRDDLAGFRSDVEAGILSGVSIGYAVPRWIETTEGGKRVKTAESIQLHEISFVPVPADAGAGTRSIGDQMTEHEQIRSIAEAVGVVATFADDLIQRNTNLADSRAAIIAEAARNMPKIDGRAAATITRETSPEDLTRAAGEALYQRINPAHKLSDMARPFAGRRLADMYREALRQRGLNTMGSDSEIVTRAMHTISDFSSGIFAETFNKSLLVLRESPPAIQQIFKRSTVSDFRAKSVFEISDGPALLKINETGEIKSGTINDKKLSSYSISSYGRIFSLSFAAQVNDDMGALSDLTAKMSRGARQWFTSLLVDTIAANPALADGKAVFHADHGNLVSGTASFPGEATVAAAKLAIRTQKDASGNPVDAKPKYILVPAALEATVDNLLAALYPAQLADVQASARGLTPITEPRLDAKSATAWYLVADPAEAPVFEYSELAGYEGPQVEVRQGFDSLGLDIRVVWHCGAGAIDYRGAFKNAGV